MVLNKKPPPKPAPAQKPAPTKPGAQSPPGQNLQPKPPPAGRPSQKQSSPAAEKAPQDDSATVKTLSSAPSDGGSPILGLDAAPVGKVFAAFLKEIAPKLRLSPTSHAILRDFSNIDVTSEKISEALRNNPYYEDLFRRVVESLAKREEQITLEAAVVLLGMQNSRNLLVGYQLYRHVTGAHPTWDPAGKIEFKSSDHLKYALKTEEVAVARKEAYIDVPYAAGLLFDLMKLIGAKLAENPKNLREPKKDEAFIDEVFAHGLRAAQLASQLSEHVPDFSYSKYIFAAGLVHDIGKVVLALLDAKYIEFHEESRKKELPRGARLFAENEMWGTNHAILGALVCRFFKILKPCERIVLYHHHPYLVKDLGKNLYTPTALTALASNIAGHLKRPEKGDDPVLKLWHGPELAGFKMSTQQITEAILKLSNLG